MATLHSPEPGNQAAQVKQDGKSNAGNNGVLFRIQQEAHFFL